MLRDKLNELGDNGEVLKNFSGAILIKRGDEIVFSYEGGFANRNWKVPNTLDTRFRVASISKMFTAVAIAQLVEKGALSFDSKLHDILDLKNTHISEDITVHHLLTHTSGISDYYDESTGDEGWNELWRERPIYNLRTLEDYLELFIHKEMEAKAGEKFKYNNAGYVLLGVIIEKLTGDNYFDYVDKNIFKRAKMEESSFVCLDEVHEKVAEGYEEIEGKWLRNIYMTTPTAGPDGGATSTVGDLIKFIQALREGKLLGEEMTRKMLVPYVLDQESNGFRNYTWKYGYANAYLLDNDENIVRGGHTGEEYGVSGRLYYYPSRGIDVAILSNIGLTAGKLGWEFHDLITECEL